MTNGEKIQTILDIDKDCTEVYGKNGMMTFSVPQNWWNAEYKEPTTKNDLGVDCISRAEAIKCLECDFDITGKENMKTVVNYINSAHDKIMNLPSVKQEPKTGHWIKENPPMVERYPFCSECGLVNPFENVSNYCPNCGCRMESEEV